MDEDYTTHRQQIEFELERSLDNGYLTHKEFNRLINALNDATLIDTPYKSDDEL
jgi:hypothetical protein